MFVQNILYYLCNFNIHFLLKEAALEAPYLRGYVAILWVRMNMILGFCIQNNIYIDCRQLSIST